MCHSPPQSSSVSAPVKVPPPIESEQRVAKEKKICPPGRYLPLEGEMYTPEGESQVWKSGCQRSHRYVDAARAPCGQWLVLNTSSLKKHLKNCCKCRSKAGNPKRNFDSVGIPQEEHSEPEKKARRDEESLGDRERRLVRKAKLLLSAMLSTSVPISFVENKYFREWNETVVELAVSCRSRFLVPGRTKASEMITEHYQLTRDKV